MGIKRSWMVLMGVTGVLFAVSVAAEEGVNEWNFETDGHYEDGDYRSVDGWTSDWTNIDKAGFAASGGYLQYDLTGNGQHILVRYGCEFDADTLRYLVLDIGMEASAPTGSGSSPDTVKFNVLFQRDGDAGIPNGFQTGVLVNHGVNRLVIDLGAATTSGQCSAWGNPWEGLVHVVRFDVAAWEQGVEGTVKINKIAFLEEAPGYEWDFDEGGSEGWSLTWDAGAVTSVADGKLVVDFEDAGFDPLVRNIHDNTDGLPYTYINSAWVNPWFYPLQTVLDTTTSRYWRFDIAMDHGTNDPVPFGAFFNTADDDLGGVTFNVTPNAGTKTYVVDMANAVNLWPAEGDAAWSGGYGVVKVLRIDPCDGLDYASCASSQVRIDYMSITDGSGDADNDGLTDAEELAAGSDPGDADDPGINVSGVITTDPVADWFVVGETVSLIAPAGSNYTWYKNGDVLSDSPPRVTGATSQTLVFDPVASNDEAVYTCVYDDGSGPLVTTELFSLDIMTDAETVPAAGILGLSLGAGLFLLGGVRTLRRRK